MNKYYHTQPQKSRTFGAVYGSPQLFYHIVPTKSRPDIADFLFLTDISDIYAEYYLLENIIFMIRKSGVSQNTPLFGYQ